MAILTIRPTGSTLSAHCAVVGAASAHEAIDESGTPDTNDYFHSTTELEEANVVCSADFDFTNHTIESGTISKITIYAYIHNSGPRGVYLTHRVKIGETYYGSNQQIIGYSAWETISEEFAVNPDTGVAWTWDDIDALIINTYIESSWGEMPVPSGSDGEIAQLYVEVTYTEAPSGWSGKIMGKTNVSKIMGIPVANISKVTGV